MAIKDEPNDLVENLGTSPRQDEIEEYTNLPDPYDDVIRQLNKSKKKAQERYKTKDFVGVVLDFDRITMTECEYETHDGFAAILGSSVILPSEKDELTVYRLKVIIPEFEGYLPTVKLSDLEFYHNTKRELGENILSENDPRYQEYEYCRRRIHRFKTFYSLQESEPTYKAPVKVSFIDDNYFYGIATSAK